MPYLTKLSIIKDLPRIQDDPILARRTKLVLRLVEQKEMAQAMIENQPYMKYHNVWVDDPDTGHKVKKSLPRKMRQWYWEQDGVWYIRCNYGNRKLALKNSMTTIKVGEIKK